MTLVSFVRLNELWSGVISQVSQTTYISSKSTLCQTDLQRYIIWTIQKMSVQKKIYSMGLYLPDEPKVPAGVVIDFAWARVHGDRVFASGHAAQAPDGTVMGPFGPVGDHVTLEQASEAAKFATLSLLASVRRALGGGPDALDRIEAVLRVDGFVLCAPGFERTTNVINGCSRLLLDIFGGDVGRHARTAMGVVATPLSCPVVVAAEFAIRPAK
ncbi:Endoribonuclease L-PSP/chorismate mutase-like protein [Rhypophila decipiens]